MYHLEKFHTNRICENFAFVCSRYRSFRRPPYRHLPPAATRLLLPACPAATRLLLPCPAAACPVAAACSMLLPARLCLLACVQLRTSNVNHAMASGGGGHT